MINPSKTVPSMTASVKLIVASIHQNGIIIIYHEFLHPPRRGSHVKSDNTHHHQHTPLSPYV